MKSEWICNICGNETKVDYIVKYDLNLGGGVFEQGINICDKCGFVFSSTNLSKEYMDKVYQLNDTTFLEDESFIHREKTQLIRRSKNQLSMVENNDIHVKDVLDIGSSTGYVLKQYKIKGLEVYGIEFAKQAIDISRRIYGIDVFEGSFEQYYTIHSDRKFDLITMSHVLEHVVDPSAFMEKVSNVNRRYIYIEVPSITEKFRDEPFGMFAEEHLNYFSVQSLNNLMFSRGYKPLEIKIDYCIKEKVANGFPMIASLWEKIDMSGDKESRLILPNINSRMVIDSYMKQSEEQMKYISQQIDRIKDSEKLAIWGTSFQMERLFAYTNLRKKNIIKFYDNSALRRQMKPFGLPVETFNIKDILEKRIDKIIITPYNSQSAILKQLDKYGIRERLVTFYD